MTEEYVNFAVTHSLTEVGVSGIMYIEEADDETPLRFYDEMNQEQWNVPSNPYDMDNNYDYWLDYELVTTALQTCDIVQYLLDYAGNESKEIVLDECTDGGEIILTID